MQELDDASRRAGVTRLAHVRFYARRLVPATRACMHAGHGDYRFSRSGHVGAARKVEQRVVRIKVGDTAGACKVAVNRNNIAAASHARYAGILDLGLAKAAQARAPDVGDVGARAATVPSRNRRARRLVARAPVA